MANKIEDLLNNDAFTNRHIGSSSEQKNQMLNYLGFDNLDKLIDEREHIALVVDEYGSVSGLVTQEDMIETLLGLEIMDESDTIEDLQLLARKSWERRAKRLGIIEDLSNEE